MGMPDRLSDWATHHLFWINWIGGNMNKYACIFWCICIICLSTCTIAVNFSENHSPMVDIDIGSDDDKN